KLDTTDKKLSYLLNQQLATNFYEYINKHRIAHFKQALSDKKNSNYSLLGLAYDAGFKSKSSFYRIFKKETGMSPSAYLKKIQKK
ncbi:MAG: helix-turn-helix domain-containing protein, partial [Bacteroidota bacterium]